MKIFLFCKKQKGKKIGVPCTPYRITRTYNYFFHIPNKQKLINHSQP